MQATYFDKKFDIQKEWLVIDATDLILGRLASEVAKILKGKHKPTYTPHMDCGDNVIIINAAKIHLTGNKIKDKKGKLYYNHTGYPGGIKERSAKGILQSKYPERVMKMAVSRMIKKTAQGKKLIKNLYVYPDMEHPHESQQPKNYDFATKNAKNVKRI